MTTDPSRRDFLQASLAALPLASGQGAKPAMSVVCIGAHPDDPESCCGGTLAAFAAGGARVTIVYLTRGERGIPGKSLDEAAAIRTAEARAACRILGAKPVFAGQIDGATEFSLAHVETMAKLVAAEAPDLVFAHWPVDAHVDHQVAGCLAYQVHRRSDGRFPLYFMEAETGNQTMSFTPTDYVDITRFHDRKLAALNAHASQDPGEIYNDHHKIMEAFRGREAGVSVAEAFIRLQRPSTSIASPNSWPR